MPDPITIGGLYLAAQAAHKAFHVAHPHICKILHQLASRGIQEGVKHLAKKVK